MSKRDRMRNEGFEALYGQPALSEEPFELRVRSFAGLVVNRHSASQHTDGRYLFYLKPEETPAECVDILQPGTVVKGHSTDGVYDHLVAACSHCKRSVGMHPLLGQEVKHWLRQMPEACKRFWEESECDGGGVITIGGDNVQGYAIDCTGCVKCEPKPV